MIVKDQRRPVISNNPLRMVRAFTKVPVEGTLCHAFPAWKSIALHLPSLVPRPWTGSESVFTYSRHKWRRKTRNLLIWSDIRCRQKTMFNHYNSQTLFVNVLSLIQSLDKNITKKNCFIGHPYVSSWHYILFPHMVRSSMQTLLSAYWKHQILEALRAGKWG